MSKTGYILITAALVTQCALVSAADEPEPNDRRLKGGEVGRYQVSAAEGILYVIDSTSGQVWSKRGQVWFDEGSPIKARRKRASAEKEQSKLELNLPQAIVSISLEQRRAKPIPGSNDRIKLYLGDITEGQSLLSIKADQDQTLLDDVSVSVGKILEFKLNQKTYYVYVRELRNILVGTDFGIFEISTVRPEVKPPSNSSAPGGKVDVADEAVP